MQVKECQCKVRPLIYRKFIFIVFLDLFSSIILRWRRLESESWPQLLVSVDKQFEYSATTVNTLFSLIVTPWTVVVPYVQNSIQKCRTIDQRNIERNLPKVKQKKIMGFIFL
jgi:hypothetical protein